MLDYLATEFDYSLDNVHLIGHSLGAHVAGLAGAAVKKGTVARITGLDPAGPPFTILDKKYKLDTSHAKFVDIIHTSIVGHGKPMGHADFYPNGGGPDQPGCKADIGSLCTHRRAHQLFTESISDQASFPAMTCDDWLSFLVRNCSTVPNRVNMGEYLSNDARGVYYLATNEKQPYTKLLSEKLKIPEYYNPSDDMFSVFE
ncbi:hypothetical protein AAG570_003951 [Ranatra chinensis]|uniref:Lipase domain-containing protein n=1 Tax=Ranatra chinensis TaxID=642074 RepID=A0ABD0Y2G3_9HEMI